MANIPTDQQNPQATEPAYPCEGPNATAYGLTKRELFAAMAMQGLCACSIPGSHHMPQERAKDAIATADALLAALDRSPP